MEFEEFIDSESFETLLKDEYYTRFPEDLPNYVSSYRLKTTVSTDEGDEIHFYK